MLHVFEQPTTSHRVMEKWCAFSYRSPDLAYARLTMPYLTASPSISHSRLEPIVAWTLAAYSKEQVSDT